MDELGNLGNLGLTIVNVEIIEAYDLVESILNRISVGSRPELHAELTKAKDALFQAWTLTDGKS